MVSFANKLFGDLYGTNQLKEKYTTQFSNDFLDPWKEAKEKLNRSMKKDEEKRASYRKDINEIIEKIEKLTIKDKDYFLNKIHNCENICLLLNEKSLYSIIELIPVSIMVLNLDMDIIYTNKKFKDIFNLDNIINKYFYAVFDIKSEYGFVEQNKELVIENKVIGHYNKFHMDYEDITYNVIQIYVNNKYYIRMFYL